MVLCKQTSLRAADCEVQLLLGSYGACRIEPLHTGFCLKVFRPSRDCGTCLISTRSITDLIKTYCLLLDPSGSTPAWVIISLKILNILLYLWIVKFQMVVNLHVSFYFIFVSRLQVIVWQKMGAVMQRRNVTTYCGSLSITCCIL